MMKTGLPDGHYRVARKSLYEPIINRQLWSGCPEKAKLKSVVLLLQPLLLYVDKAKSV
jgi:hypothetical protein